MNSFFGISSHRSGRAWVGAALVMLAATGFAQTQPSAEAPAAAAQAPLIEAKKKGLDEDNQLTPEAKAKAQELYDRAESAIEQTKAAQAKLAELTQRIEAAPGRVAELRKALETADAATAAEDTTLPEDTSVEQIQALLSEKQAQLGVARDELKGLETSLSQLVTSGSAIVKEWVDREKSMRQLAEEAETPPPPDELPVVLEARKTYLAARRQLEQTELNALQLRARNYDLLVEVTTLERDAKAVEVARLQKQSRALSEALQTKREIDARAAVREAEATRAESAQLPQPVAAVAERNAELQSELEQVIGEEEAVSDDLSDVAQRYRATESELASLRERVRTYGASQAVGGLLQRSLERLPSIRKQRGRTRKLREEIARATDRTIELTEERQSFGALDSRIESVLATVGATVKPAELEPLRVKTTELLTTQRNVLAELERTYTRYLRRLTALDAAQIELGDLAAESGAFIREQLTWIPNLPPLSFRDFWVGASAFLGVFSPVLWQTALYSIGATFENQTVLSLVSLVLVVGMFALRRRAPARLAELAEKTLRVRTDSFGHTAEALAYTVVAASPWAAVLAMLGWQLRADAIGGTGAFVLGDSLLDMVAFVFALSLLRWVTRADGLANRHFRWSAPVWKSVHRELWWFAMVIIPAKFLITLASESERAGIVVAVGRPLLLIALIAMAVFLWRVFGRNRPLMRNMLQQHPDGWLARLWIVWFGLLLAAPVSLGISSALGYNHTAAALTGLAIGETAYLVIGLLILKHLLLRWFYVAERRSRFAVLTKQRDESRASRQRGDDESDKTFFDIDVPEPNYRELGEQARSVVGVGVLLGFVVGIGALWGDLLPTIGFLESVHFPITKISVVEGVEQTSSVTLFDVAIALLIAAGTVFAAKNLSGLLEFTILRRIRLDAGGHYAIVTLCQYLVVAIGVIAAFTTIGLQWSKLQWLIAALGVGLGFGLQEIVANFVSGIILLLERPVRIGDIVTVGNADGYISRIQIRATTILTWERKELIVPNKEFITGQVVNWTLSDGMNRILINVGIAYGSDVGKALELIAGAAKENEQVLADPSPIVTFEAFGDNALNLYLRCYIASMDNRLATITALHQAIYDKFTDAGIVIAFPQRDIHIDTSKPLEIKLQQDAAESAAKLREARSGAA
jgi:potassium efflux system protein